MAPKAKAVQKKPAGKFGKQPLKEVEDEEAEEFPEEEEEEDEEEYEEVPAAPVESPKRGTSQKSSPPAKKGASPSKVSPPSVSPPKKRAGPSTLQVSFSLSGAAAAPLCESLVQLRRKVLRCDAVVVAAGGSRIPVHSLVLASQSQTLLQRLQPGTDSNPSELVLETSHEAADHLVRYVYGEIDVDSYSPSSPKMNEEVLRLASELGLPMLAQFCATRLAIDVNVKNVVERVRLCEDFGLPELRQAIVGALVEDRGSLEAVARDEATLGHPALMRELLAGLAAKAREESSSGLDAEDDAMVRPHKQARVMA